MHIYMHARAHMRTHPLEFEISWEKLRPAGSLVPTGTHT